MPKVNNRVSGQSACVRDVAFIAAYMRSEDWDEIRLQLPAEVSPTVAALQIFDCTPADTRFVAYVGDSPVAAYGFSPTTNPTLWSAWAFGTKRMSRAIPALTRHAFGHCYPLLMSKYQPKRCEVRAHATHDIAHKWLTGLGCVFEADLPRYGIDGSDYKQYAWTDLSIRVPVDRFKRRQAQRNRLGAI